MSEPRVLVVGAGGIGCELLKTIVLAGLNDIEIIDLDTIDVSNLNRQFLFRREHVGKPKAEIAKESVMKVRPNIKIVAHHNSVFEKKFGVKWLKTFNVVINALDNLKARRHMNRMCLAADVPLVDGGTGGYQGQVTVHRKGHTQCYECEEKPTPKTYPVCTIRSTPDKIEHCVTWSKYFFEILFGKEDDSNMLADMTQDGSAAEDAAEAPAQSIRWQKGESGTDYSWRVFQRAFQLDIETQAKMFEEADKKKPPEPLSGFTHADAAAAAVFEAGVKRTIEETQQTGALQEQAASFFSCVRAMVDTRSEEIGGLTFDKDDDLALDFVVAASNLRATVFKILPTSHFKIKSIAGAIIPAIATTNAIVSGLIVIEVLKLLAEKFDKAQAVYVSASSTHPLSATRMPPPNPLCMVCRPRPPMIECWIDTKNTTLGELVAKVLKDKLGFLEPTVDVTENGRELCLFEDEEESEENLPKILADFYMGDNTIACINDYTQDLEAKLLIVHKDKEEFDEDKDPAGFRVSAQPDQPKEQEAAGGTKRKAEDAIEEAPAKKQAVGDDDDDLVIL